LEIDREVIGLTTLPSAHKTRTIEQLKPEVKAEGMARVPPAPRRRAWRGIARFVAGRFVSSRELGERDFKLVEQVCSSSSMCGV
jgi:hypothetical protein